MPLQLVLLLDGILSYLLLYEHFSILEYRYTSNRLDNSVIKPSSAELSSLAGVGCDLLHSIPSLKHFFNKLKSSWNFCIKLF